MRATGRKMCAHKQTHHPRHTRVGGCSEAQVCRLPAGIMTLSYDTKTHHTHTNQLLQLQIARLAATVTTKRDHQLDRVRVPMGAVASAVGTARKPILHYPSVCTS
jgi:hypothetical protein